MKKFFFFAIAVSFSVIVFAQNAMVNTLKHKPLITKKATIYHPSQAKAIIWQSDFSVPSDWIISHNAGTTGDWVIGTGVPSGNNPIAGIASTTAANGFALFDSDDICSGNQIANLSTTNYFSCTGHPSVALTFEQYYKKYNDSTFVYVSTDGAFWTKFIVNNTLGHEDFTANPLHTSVDISSVAANQAAVWIRFTFYSPFSMGGNPGCGYAWMVDDVKVIDLVPYDIAATKSFLDLDGTGYGYYEVIPYSQMGTVSYGEDVMNNGSSALTNVTLNLDINNGAITVNSAAIASLAATANDTLWAQPAISVPDTPTLYKAKLSVTQTETDANLADNVGDSVSFLANPNYFSRTQDFDNFLTPYSFGTDAPPTTGMEFGANYKFTNADLVDSISAIIYDATPNTSITAKLYTVTGVNVHTLVGQSLPFTLVPANLPAYITLGLTTPYNVAAGTTLCATISMAVNIANNDTIYVGSDEDYFGNAAVAGAAYLEVNSVWGWYPITGIVPIVDLILHDPSAGIDMPETSDNIIVFPNPANDKLYITANNITSVEIYNLIGEVVASYGNENLITTSDLMAGTYILKIITDSKIDTKKITIVR